MNWYDKWQIMNRVFLRCMCILIICMGSVGTYGQQQTYPVQVYTQLTPPTLYTGILYWNTV